MKTLRERFLDWNIYQVYLRSFLDTNGDGIGDLDGVRAKLDYLQELGINAIWISPCYESPNVDNGYDVSNYYQISKEFGGMDAWSALLEDLHARGMKLVMDLVVNHTSSNHPWFLDAKTSKKSPYHDYYIWAKKPPNNWQSVFGGSAWEYNEATKEYYLHSFAIEQPDLNWENPNVREECRKIVEYWTKLGVDGFRCDVLDYISKDFEKGKMYNGPKLHTYIRQLFNGESTARLFTLGECQSTSKNILRICGKDRKELTTVFQFDHIALGKKDKYTPKAFCFDELKKLLIQWQEFVEKNELLYVLFTDNHDQTFFLSRLGNDKEFRYECATMLATMFYLLKGIPVVFQGQEFGCANSDYTEIKAYKDVETLQYYRMRKDEIDCETLWKKILFSSRDHTRRPIAWTKNGDTMYGFTDKTPWISPPSRADEINLETDKNSEKSIFAFYKKLFHLRLHSPAIRYGKFENISEQKNCFLFRRTYFEEEILIVCNFEREQEIMFPKTIKEEHYQLVLQNYADRTGAKNLFRPYEIAVFTKNCAYSPLQNENCMVK